MQPAPTRTNAVGLQPWALQKFQVAKNCFGRAYAERVVVELQDPGSRVAPFTVWPLPACLDHQLPQEVAVQWSLEVVDKRRANWEYLPTLVGQENACRAALLYDMPLCSPRYPPSSLPSNRKRPRKTRSQPNADLEAIKNPPVLSEHRERATNFRQAALDEEMKSWKVGRQVTTYLLH